MFEIGIPTINRADLLIPALIYYLKDYPNTKIWITDNGKQNLTDTISKLPTSLITVIENDNNIGVAASWNLLCDKIFEKSDNALILNDDIYLGDKLELINELITKRTNVLLRATPDWCAFVMPKSVFKNVGRFDEEFYPAYYEDISYEYRMKLKGIQPVKTSLLNPYIYRSSKTMEKMPELQELAKKNRKLYIKMWGGDVGQEKFKKPFNLIEN